MASGKSESVRVEIFGNEYMIKGTQDSQFIDCLAQYVDKKMRDIANKTSVVASNKVAILAALNIAEELFTIKEKNEKKHQKVKEKVAELIKKIEENLDDDFSGLK